MFIVIFRHLGDHLQDSLQIANLQIQWHFSPWIGPSSDFAHATMSPVFSRLFLTKSTISFIFLLLSIEANCLCFRVHMHPCSANIHSTFGSTGVEPHGWSAITIVLIHISAGSLLVGDDFFSLSVAGGLPVSCAQLLLAGSCQGDLRSFFHTKHYECCFLFFFEFSFQF